MNGFWQMWAVLVDGFVGFVGEKINGILGLK